MREKNLLRLFLCAPLLLGACGGAQADNSGKAAASANAQATPSAAQQQQQEVTVTVDESRLPAGGSTDADIILDIAPGYHVHANPASDKYYVATEVSAEPQQGLSPGKPVYPKAVTKKLSFSEQPLAVYEGSVVIKLPLTAVKDAPKGRHTLRARVRVQPCDDTVCKPPRDIDVRIPVTIN